MIEPYDDTYFMKRALQEAEEAYEQGEIPIGAVIVANNQIIARAHNLTETLNDVTAHAEMQAITSAASFLGGKYLQKCTLYVTIEPCQMCAGALYWSQISNIVYGGNKIASKNTNARWYFSRGMFSTIEKVFYRKKKPQLAYSLLKSDVNTFVKLN